VGMSNYIVFPFYKKEISVINDPVALLGFTDNNLFSGDLYDKRLNNWEINSDWKLNKKYSTIISTRCPYFAKNPNDFIIKCYESLEKNGRLYVDWGLGDHWRFPIFKVGWVKNNDHEFAYFPDNYLWSFVWDDSFLQDDQFKIFEVAVKSKGYDDIKKAIFDEIPCVLPLKFIERFFVLDYKILTVIKPFLHMYVLIRGTRKDIISND